MASDFLARLEYVSMFDLVLMLTSEGEAGELVCMVPDYLRNWARNALDVDY